MGETIPGNVAETRKDGETAVVHGQPQEKSKEFVDTRPVSTELADAYEELTGKKRFEAHIANEKRHVTDPERAAWNAKYDMPAGGIPAADLAANSVTAAKIANAAVGTAKLANNAVTEAKISNGAVTKAKLAADVQTSLKSIDALVKDAPEAFDTLKEIADWIAADETGTAALVAEVAAKRGKTDLAVYDPETGEATGDSLAKLSDIPGEEAMAAASRYALYAITNGETSPDADPMGGYTLRDRTENLLTMEESDPGNITPVVLPDAVDGKVSDFAVVATNPLASAASLKLFSYTTNAFGSRMFSMVLPVQVYTAANTDSLSELLEVGAGKTVEFYFTLKKFHARGLHTWRVDRRELHKLTA